MRQVHWTGHPFVDAGLAALAAAVDIRELGDLSPSHLKRAVQALKRVLLSDQAMGVGVGKSFVGGPMSQLFPNSELVNPSNRRGKDEREKVENVRRKFSDALKQDLERAERCLSGPGELICAFCGRECSKDSAIAARKDKMPLLEGIVNFYPAFAYGVTVCGVCALAVRFLPLSVMRTGVRNRLWFLHTQVLPISASIAKCYGWDHFNDAIARNEAVDFYNRWETAGDAGTVLYLLCELLEKMGGQIRSIYLESFPTTAYIFSNDNRDSFVQALSIPHELLTFLARLQVRSQSAFRRFRGELFHLSADLDKETHKRRIGFVQSVADRILRGESVIGSSLVDDPQKLLGGWLGHGLYLHEVRKMSATKLDILERLGLTLAQSEDAKKRVQELSSAKAHRLYGIFLGYVRAGWLTHKEYYTLLPPNRGESASELRDILLGIAYEWERCQEEGGEFPRLELHVHPPSPDDTLQRIQAIGERLLQSTLNHSRWVGQLQTARTSARIRGAYLAAVQRRAMGLSDFVFLAPLEDARRLWLLRDYLLAFLFERLGEVPEEEIAVGGEEEADLSNIS